MSVRITGLGLRALLFLALLWATYFAIPYTNLFFFGITFLTVWLCLAWLWTMRGLRGLRVQARGVPCTAGAPIRVHLDVRPLSPGAAMARARMNVHVVVDLDAGPLRSEAFHMPSEGTVTVELPARERGIHRVHRAALETSAPFGLFRVRAPLPGFTEVVVYPAPSARPTQVRTAASASATDAARTVAQGPAQPSDRIAGLRDYHAGDDSRHVHWRGTARRGTLVVRDLDPEASSQPHVVLDRRGTADALEVALASIVTLALRAREEQARLTLSTQGLVRTFACGRPDFDALLRVLAGLEPLSSEAGAPRRADARDGGAP